MRRMLKFLYIFLGLFLFLYTTKICFSSSLPFSDDFTDSQGTLLTTHNSAYSINLNGNATNPTIQNNQLQFHNPDFDSSSSFQYILPSAPSSLCVQGDFTVPNYTSRAGNWNLGTIDFAGYSFIMNMDNNSRNTLQEIILQDSPFSVFGNTGANVTLPSSGSVMTFKACNNNGEIIYTLNGDTIYHITGGNAPSGDVTITVGTAGFDELFDNFSVTSSSVTPTPTPAQNIIAVSPSTSTVTVGTPFNVTLAVNGGQPFNAAQAHVAVSANLSITGIHSAPSPACNLQYTQTPTTSDPSFAGAIYGNSSTNCNVYTLTLTPNAAGTGTITLTNGSIKSYADNSEILTGVTNGSFTISAANATPTPTPPLSGITFTSPSETYNSSYTLTGTKDASTTTIFVNGSSTGVTYPTSTTWQATETLTLGANNTAGNNTFTVYGTDGNGNQTATVTDTVSLHTLGDINGDGQVDLTDASLFAIDWGKTSDFTYALSDMNGDSKIDLTDLSILAKLEAQ